MILYSFPSRKIIIAILELLLQHENFTNQISLQLFQTNHKCSKCLISKIALMFLINQQRVIFSRTVQLDVEIQEPLTIYVPQQEDKTSLLVLARTYFKGGLSQGLSPLPQAPLVELHDNSKSQLQGRFFLLVLFQGFVCLFVLPRFLFLRLTNILEIFNKSQFFLKTRRTY